MKSSFINKKSVKLDLINSKKIKSQDKKVDFTDVVAEVNNRQEKTVIDKNNDSKIKKTDCKNVAAEVNNRKEKTIIEKNNDDVKLSKDVEKFNDIKKKIKKLEANIGKISKEDAKKEISKIMDTLKQIGSEEDDSGDNSGLDSFVEVLSVLDKISSLLGDFKIDLKEDKDFKNNLIDDLKKIANKFSDDIEEFNKKDEIGASMIFALISLPELNNVEVKKSNNDSDVKDELNLDNNDKVSDPLKNISLDKLKNVLKELQKINVKIKNFSIDEKSSNEDQKSSNEIEKKIKFMIEKISKVAQGNAPMEDKIVVSKFLENASEVYSNIETSKKMHISLKKDEKLKNILETFENKGKKGSLFVKIKDKQGLENLKNSSQNEDTRALLEKLKINNKNGMKFDTSISMEKVNENVGTMKNKIMENNLSAEIVDDVSKNDNKVTSLAESLIKDINLETNSIGKIVKKDNLNEHIMTQIETKMKFNVKSLMNGKEVKIQLEPENLGKVSIKIDYNKNSEMTAKIKVDNSHVLGLVKDNLSKLKDILTDAGVKNIDVHVDVNQDKGQAESQSHRDAMYNSMKNGFQIKNKEDQDENLPLESVNRKVYKDSIYEILA